MLLFLILAYFLCIPASAPASAAVNPKAIKTLLANGWDKFFTEGKPAFSDGHRHLPRNPPNCNILDI